LKREYGIMRTIVVADKGLNTGDNIAFNILAGNGYVFSQSVRGGNKDLKDFVLEEKGYKALNEGFKSKSRLTPRTISVTTKEGKKKKVEVDEKQVAVYSAKYAQKAKKDREAVIAKARDLISNPSKYRRATSYGASRYVENLIFDPKSGEIITSNQKLVFAEERLKEEEKYDGYYVIVTSEYKKSDEEILSIYKGLWQIEEAFRVSKSDMEARPVYLSRHDRIEAHFLICFIALVIARLLAYRLDNRHSIKKLAESLNAMAYSFVEQNIYVGDFASEITVDLKEKLKLDLDHKYMTYGEIRKLIATTKRHSPPAS
ncbi:MAG: IS1634 family transposase, partial [Patescibacteria group bacterium]|nr:IS1634 family transposase [Patescibacteria group bacterium]